jgi:hypothetical protein
MSDVLTAAKQARLDSFRARRDYHDTLVAAAKAGHPASAIASYLGTKTLYVENTLRLHRELRCGCLQQGDE